MSQLKLRIGGMLVESHIFGKDISFFVHQPEDSIQRYHMQGEFYEIEEMNLMSRYLKPTDSYLDIGSNIGNHLLFIGKILGLRNLVAIEPNPLAIAILKTNIRLNQLDDCVDLSCLGFGLSDEPGQAVLEVPRNNLGGATMVSLQADSPEQNPISIRVGDEVFPERHFDFIKMDVEGMELKCLAGLRGLIERCQPIMFIEVDDENAEAFKKWCTDNAYKVEETYRRYPVNENYLIVPA